MIQDSNCDTNVRTVSFQTKLDSFLDHDEIQDKKQEVTFQCKPVW